MLLVLVGQLKNPNKFNLLGFFYIYTFPKISNYLLLDLNFRAKIEIL